MATAAGAEIVIRQLLWSRESDIVYCYFTCLGLYNNKNAQCDMSIQLPLMVLGFGFNLFFRGSQVESVDDMAWIRWKCSSLGLADNNVLMWFSCLCHSLSKSNANDVISCFITKLLRAVNKWDHYRKLICLLILHFLTRHLSVFDNEFKRRKP